MPNYNLVINSQFKPFSYQEMLAPVLMATQAHQELENQYGELATKASVWEEMANEQTDPYAYKMYKAYANDLEAQANQLAREGLNAASKRDMLNMRSRYSKEITPIEQAYATRQKQAEEQQKALLQDPTLMLSRRAATTSLDDYIRNPQLAYESYSGKLLTAQVSQAASALSKEMREQPRKWRSILGNSYYETMMRKGFSSDAVLQAIQGNPQASQELTRIVDDAVASSGVSGWGDAATIARATDYARQGLWSAVGETQYQTLDNWRAKMDYEAELKRRAAEQAKLNSLAINPANLYNYKEADKATKNIKDFSKYFKVDAKGNVKITTEGLEEYKRNASQHLKDYTKDNYQQYYNEDMFTPTAFREFIDSLGIDQKYGEVDNLNVLSPVLEKAWSDYVQSHDYSKYDATKSTEFDYSIDSTQQGDWKDAILTAARGSGKLKEVDYDASSSSFKETGETLSVEDLRKDGYKITATRFSPYGSTVMVQDTKGNVKRYELPSGINTYNEGFRDERMKEAYKIQETLKDPSLTPSERYELQNYYKEVLQQAYLYHSQLGVRNKTKEQEYNPYGN